MHREDLIVPGIVVIVALHFIPLARLFRRPIYHWLCAVMIAWVAACCGLRFSSGDARMATMAIGTGLILWLSASVVLFQTRKPPTLGAEA